MLNSWDSTRALWGETGFWGAHQLCSSLLAFCLIVILRHLGLFLFLPLGMQSMPPDVGEAAARPEMIPKQTLASVQVPRISIRFCTQCHWMLRAAYVRAIFVLLSSLQPFSLFFLFDVSIPKSSLSPLIFNQLLFRDMLARSGALLLPSTYKSCINSDMSIALLLLE